MSFARSISVVFAAMVAVCSISCDEDGANGVAVDELGRPVVNIPEKTTYNFAERRDTPYPFQMDVLRGWAEPAMNKRPPIVFVLRPSGPTKVKELGGGAANISATTQDRSTSKGDPRVEMNIAAPAVVFMARRQFQDVTAGESRDYAIDGAVARLTQFDYTEKGKPMKAQHLLVLHAKMGLSITLYAEPVAFEKARADFMAMVDSIRWVEIPPPPADEPSSRPGE